MKVFVKTVDGQTVPVDVSPHDSVRTLKRKVFDEIHVPPDQQKLVFIGNISLVLWLIINYLFFIPGKTLVDDRTLNEYRVNAESTIHLLVEKKRGEMIRIYVKSLTG